MLVCNPFCLLIVSVVCLFVFRLSCFCILLSVNSLSVIIVPVNFGNL